LNYSPPPASMRQAQGRCRKKRSAVSFQLKNMSGFSQLDVISEGALRPCCLLEVLGK
jgi:hypothetical protein